ncbi:MAG: heme ABC exporter ATP-binding protein CcmA [Fimbriimonadaceae bacterium]|nr:heme ABC exporter ATP-binding protein CcmA [Alphaproteobacteria bacterium]
MTRLIVNLLKAQRGERVLFQDLSFDIAAGQSLLVEGANGCGKTTLLRTIAGFARPDAGSVTLEDGQAEADLREQLHYIGHLDGAKGTMTVEENLIFWCRYLGGNTSAMPQDLFGLEEIFDIPAHYLSAGQRRKLALTRLLAVKRAVWLLDEPSVSLDTEARAILSAMMTQHVKDGGILLATSHTDLGVSFSRHLRLGVNR